MVSLDELDEAYKNGEVGDDLESKRKWLQKQKEARYHKDKGVVERSGKTPQQAMFSHRVLGVSLENIDRMIAEKAGTYEKQLIEQENRAEQEEAQLRNEVIMLLATKERSKATEKIVQYIEKENNIYTTRDDDKPEIYIYNQGIYIPNGETIIKEITRRIFGLAFTSQLCNDIVNKIMADTYIDIDKFFNINYKDEICVQNGILNIKTRTLSPFTPKKVFFNKCPVIYDKDISCEVIDSFLSDVLAQPEDKKVYYEIGGFCLLKEYTYEKAFMFIGNGRNGKGKSLELIKRVIGAENTISLPLAALSHENADVSQLFTKMVNLAGDIGFADLKDTSMFKGLTGRDLVTAKRKFKTAVIFENYAKFIFACNELPRVYDMSAGFWDRWILLDFPYYFADREKWEQTCENDRKGWKIRDDNIIDKIATPEQLSGLLNAFLDGLDRLFKSGRFSTTKGTEEVKNLWIRKSNSFMAFCMDKIDEDYNEYITKKELRNKFSKYCKIHKIKSASDKDIKATLEMMFGATENQRTVFNDIERIWEGIKWK